MCKRIHSHHRRFRDFLSSRLLARFSRAGDEEKLDKMIETRLLRLCQVRFPTKLLNVAAEAYGGKPFHKSFFKSYRGMCFRGTNMGSDGAVLRGDVCVLRKYV